MDNEKISVGFWKHGKRLFSSWLRKSDIPKGCRLMLVKNKYYEKDGNKPYYIGYFIKTNDHEAEDIKHPYLVLKSSMEGEEEDEDDG